MRSRAGLWIAAFFFWFNALATHASAGPAQDFDQATPEGVRIREVLARGRTVAFDPSAVKNAAQATVAVLDALPGERPHSDSVPTDIKGAGFHIGDGYIVTALHVARHQRLGENVVPRSLSILTSRREELAVHLIGINEAVDLAMYRVSHEQRKLLGAGAKFGDGESAPGDEVFTVGFPGGYLATTFGHVSATDAYLRTAQVKLTQLNISICGGNSGGGLFNARGEVVGMVQSIVSTEGGLGFVCSNALVYAIGAPLLKKVIAALKEGKRAPFSALGIEMGSVKIGSQWRVSIDKVFAPALSAGVRPGDVLLSLNEMIVEDAAQVKSYLLESTVPGQRVGLRVLRGGATILIQVELAGS